MIDIKIPKLQGLWFNINETLISSTDSKLKNWNEIEEIYVLIDYLVDGLNMIADDQLKILLNLMKIAFFRVFEIGRSPNWTILFYGLVLVKKIYIYRHFNIM